MAMKGPQPWGKPPAMSGWAGVQDGDNSPARCFIAVDKGVLFVYENIISKIHSTCYNLQDSICNNTTVADSKGQKTALKIKGPNVKPAGVILILDSDSSRIEWASAIIEASISVQEDCGPPLPAQRHSATASPAIGIKSPNRPSPTPSSSEYEVISLDERGLPQGERQDTLPMSPIYDTTGDALQDEQSRARRAAILRRHRSSSADSVDSTTRSLQSRSLISCGSPHKYPPLPETPHHPMAGTSLPPTTSEWQPGRNATRALPKRPPLTKSHSTHNMSTPSSPSPTALRMHRSSPVCYPPSDMPHNSSGSSSPTIPEGKMPEMEKMLLDRQRHHYDHVSLSDLQERIARQEECSSPMARARELLQHPVDVAHLPEEESIFVSKCLRQAKAILQEAMDKMHKVEQELEAAEREREAAEQERAVAYQLKKQALDILKQAKSCAM